MHTCCYVSQVGVHLTHTLPTPAFKALKAIVMTAPTEQNRRIGRMISLDEPFTESERESEMKRLIQTARQEAKLTKRKREETEHAPDKVADEFIELKRTRRATAKAEEEVVERVLHASILSADGEQQRRWATHDRESSEPREQATTRPSWLSSPSTNRRASSSSSSSSSSSKSQETDIERAKRISRQEADERNVREIKKLKAQVQTPSIAHASCKCASTRNCRCEAIRSPAPSYIKNDFHDEQPPTSRTTNKRSAMTTTSKRKRDEREQSVSPPGSDSEETFTDAEINDRGEFEEKERRNKKQRTQRVNARDEEEEDDVDVKPHRSNASKAARKKKAQVWVSETDESE